MKSKKTFLIAVILFLLFAGFTAIVSFVDVQPIGPEQSEIGLASINQFAFERLGVHLIWYDITDWLGVVAILFAVGFSLLGLTQLIKRKSLLKVDYQILLLGVFYVIVIAAYIFFEYAIINYRPIILHTNLEASYPSSHTMIVICIMVTAMIEFQRLFANRKTLRVILDSVSALIITVTVVGRMISGVHWFTDIVAGILLSAALVMLYYSTVKFIAEKEDNTN